MRKGIEVFVLTLAAALVALAFVLRLFTALGGTVFESERLIVQLVFVFACFSGIITSAGKKQLSIEILTPLFGTKIQMLIKAVIASVNIMLLTALFFSVFPNYTVFSASEDSVLHIPVTVFFSALPGMYAAILALEIKRTKKAVPVLTGLVLGIIISAGSLAGIMDLCLGNFYPEINASAVYRFLDAAFVFMQGLSGKLIWLFILLFSAAALFGMPLYLALSGIAYFAFMQAGGFIESVPMEAYRILTDTSIAAIPLFTIAGYLLAGGSAGGRLLEFVKGTVGWIRGGVVIAAVLVATFFTTFTGASGVTILALGGILSVILTGSDYSENDSEALITASGSIGLLLPPSLAVIVYGATNFMSINIFDLFKGAFFPGILLALSMIVIGVIKDKNKERQKFSGKAVLSGFKNSFFELLLPGAIVLMYFSGCFSLFETASFSVLYAFVLEVFIRKDFSLKKAARVILESIPIAGGVLIIIGSAKALAVFLVYAGVPDALSEFVLTFVSSKYVFLLLLNILLLLVGCIMDLYSAILVVSPLIIPVAETFGIHPVHTGVIFLTNLALGFLTPPIGMNLFIASYTFKKPIPNIIKSILPYLAVQFIILLLITYIPWFSTAFIAGGQP